LARLQQLPLDAGDGGRGDSPDRQRCAVLGEFQHSTPAGPRTGLLLPPHGSYSFGGRTDNAVEADDATTDYVAYADISFTPVGVADATGPIARDAGTFTVLVPPSTTTTTEISA